jgi:acid phosphatase type 7
VRDYRGNTSTDSISVTALNTSRTATFAPVADASIKPAAPTTNYGAAGDLEVDSSAVEHFLLKFTVTGVGSTVYNAKLRLYNVNASDRGGDFYAAAHSSWTEGTVNYSNAPAAVGSPAASLGAVVTSTWYEVELGSVITGDGTYTIRVQSTSSNGADYQSKEGGANAPRLILTFP